MLVFVKEKGQRVAEIAVFMKAFVSVQAQRSTALEQLWGFGRQLFSPPLGRDDGAVACAQKGGRFIFSWRAMIRERDGKT